MSIAWVCNHSVEYGRECNLRIFFFFLKKNRNPISSLHMSFRNVIYIYVYAYVCARTYMCVYTQCVYICVSMHVYMCVVYVWIYTHVCMCAVCDYVYVYTCVYVGVCIYMCVLCVYACAKIHRA